MPAEHAYVQLSFLEDQEMGMRWLLIIMVTANGNLFQAK